MKRILIALAIAAFFCVGGHAQFERPLVQPQLMPYSYYRFPGYLQADSGILLPQRVANFTPKRSALIYDTGAARIKFYLNGWKALQDVAFTGSYTSLVDTPTNVTTQGNTFNGAYQLLQLDNAGKVYFANLPSTLMTYKGTWSAATNTPALANGTGVSGWMYQAIDSGVVDFGSGPITFFKNDYVGYNGSVWQWSPGNPGVRSVNGFQNIVSLTTVNIPESGSVYYWTAARSRAAQSVTATGLTYDNSTGVISLTVGYTIPLTTDLANWNTAYSWGNWAAGTHYVGTTLIANNRASGAQTLTGVSIDGTAGSETLATVTGRGASTSTAISLNGGLSATTAQFSGSIVQTGTYPMNLAPMGGTYYSQGLYFATDMGSANHGIRIGGKYFGSGDTRLVVEVSTGTQAYGANPVSLTYTEVMNISRTAGVTFANSLTAGATNNSGGDNVVSVINGGGTLYTTRSILRSSVVGSNAELRTIYGAGYGQVGMTTNEGFGIITNNATRIYVQNSGNTGFGTTTPNSTVEILGWDGTGARTNPFDVLTITAENANSPYAGFGGGIVFRNRSYASGVVNSARIRSVINDASVVNNGGSIDFDVTNTVGSGYNTAMRIEYTGNIILYSYAGSGNRILYTNAAGRISTMVIGSGLSFDGTTLSATGGSSGTVTGSGTSGVIALWNSASDIGNSIMSQSAATINVAGSLTVSGNITASNALIANNYIVATGTVTGSSFYGAGTGLTGTASGLNIGGNAATATNSTQWASQAFTGGTDASFSYLLGSDGAGTWQAKSATSVKSFLGLGSAAYTASSAYYAAGSTVANSTAWNGYSFSFTNGAVSTYMMTWNGSSFALSAQPEVQAFLGLGSYAYRSSGLAELTGATFTGAVNGTTAYFTGSVTAGSFFEIPSDIRKKEVVQRWASADGMDAIAYYLKDDISKKIMYGFEAQQVMKVLPTAVATHEDKTMADGITYSVGYTQVLVYKIAMLEKRIENLENAIKK